MKVLFDGYWWFRGPTSNRMVQRELIEAWHAEYPGDSLAILIPSRYRGEEMPSWLEPVYSRLPLQALSNAISLPIAARRLKSDAILAHNFSPLWGQRAVFIHDFLFLDHPEWFTAKENAYFRLMRSMARGRAQVFTSSRTESQRISRYLRGAKVIPIGLAMGTSFRHAIPDPPSSGLESGKFLLTVGRLNVRKNLGFTIRAAIASGRVGPHFPLVVIGERSGRTGEFTVQEEEALETGSVILLGTVTEGTLKWLYSNAALFVFLSLDEGFGLPCIEARELGARIIASDIGVFREVLSNDAEFVDPTNLAQAAQGIRTTLAENGSLPSVTPEYSWAKSVSALRRNMAEGSR